MKGEINELCELPSHVRGTPSASPEVEIAKGRQTATCSAWLGCAQLFGAWILYIMLQMDLRSLFAFWGKGGLPGKFDPSSIELLLLWKTSSATERTASGKSHRAAREEGDTHLASQISPFTKAINGGYRCHCQTTLTSRNQWGHKGYIKLQNNTCMLFRVTELILPKKKTERFPTIPAALQNLMQFINNIGYTLKHNLKCMFPIILSKICKVLVTDWPIHTLLLLIWPHPPVLLLTSKSVNSGIRQTAAEIAWYKSWGSQSWWCILHCTDISEMLQICPRLLFLHLLNVKIKGAV